jgi:hypothetical protein
MPYRVSWYDEEAIVLMEYQGEVTLVDLIHANQSLLDDYLMPAEQPIHILTDVSGMTKIAFSFEAASTNESIVEAANHPMLGEIAYCDRDNPMYRMMAKAGMDENFYANRDEAGAHLRRFV